MPTRLRRYYNLKHLHFITCSCYHRLPLLSTPSAREVFLTILEETRQRYRFVVSGYVVMPEHFHLLTSEPEVGDPSVIMKVVKERSSRKLRALQQPHSFAKGANEWATLEHFWQKRFYDFNVWSESKREQKLNYIHNNPMKRGLVDEPDQWRWSSYRSYAHQDPGLVRINFQEWPLEIEPLPRQSFGGDTLTCAPLIRTERE
jgi:putative transposase